MKIPSDVEINFLDPMDDEALLAYAQVIADNMDDDGNILPAGLEFLQKEGNTPCEDDQTKIIALQEDLHNAKDNSKEEAVSEAESTSGEEAGEEGTSEEVTAEAVAEVNAPAES